MTKLAEIEIFQILVKTVWGGTAKDPIHSGVFLLKKKYLFVHFYLITYLVLNLSRLIRLILNRSFFSRKVLKKSPRHRKENSPDTDSKGAHDK